MRSLGIVIPPIVLDLLSGIAQIKEDVLIETLVSELPVERFDVGVLNRFPWIDEVELDVVSVGPFIQGFAGELRPVVTDDHLGQRSFFLDPVQDLHEMASGNRMTHLNHRRFPAAVIDERKALDPASRSQLIRDKVHRPALIGPCGGRHHHSQMTGPFLSLPKPKG